MVAGNRLDLNAFKYNKDSHLPELQYFIPSYIPILIVFPLHFWTDLYIQNGMPTEVTIDQKCTLTVKVELKTTDDSKEKTNNFRFEFFIELDGPAWPQWASFDTTLQSFSKI